MFDALEWLAAMNSHVPSQGEQMVRYYDDNPIVRTGNRRGMTPERNGNLRIPSKAGFEINCVI